MPNAGRVATFVIALGAILLGWTSGCGSNKDSGDLDGGDDGSPGSQGSGSGGPLTGVDASFGTTNVCTADGSACVGACRNQGKTTLTGRVFDPAGKNPLWNVQVYVPYHTPGPMPVGPICNCSSVFTGSAIAAAQTDATGTFTIGDVYTPAPGPVNGSTIPIVVQVGKWRYQTRVPVTCGVENKVPDGILRLPDGRTGSSDPNVRFPGDLPDIAISTGGCDSLECLLRRVGVQASEFVAGPGSPSDGHIHIYQGSPSGGGAGSAPNTSPPAPQSSANLWATTQQLMAYDVVLLSCEGNETQGVVPSSLASYVKMGGRAFASHYHYNWFVNPNTGASADPTFSNFGVWFTKYVNAVEGPVYGIVQTTLPNGATFPEGAAMKQWLNTVGATGGGSPAGDGGIGGDGGDGGGGGSGNAGGVTNELPIFQARHNVDVYFPEVAVPWMDFDPARVSWPAGLSYDPVTPNSTLYLSWDSMSANGAAETSCGRVVYSDLHVGGNSGDYGASPSDTCTKWNGTPVPLGCNTTVDLSPQEKALEFMLFDLTGCLAPPGVDAGVQVPVAR